jgi:hypothetical protein
MQDTIDLDELRALSQALSDMLTETVGVEVLRWENPKRKFLVAFLREARAHVNHATRFLEEAKGWDK